MEGFSRSPGPYTFFLPMFLYDDNGGGLRKAMRYEDAFIPLWVALRPKIEFDDFAGVSLPAFFIGLSSGMDQRLSTKHRNLQRSEDRATTVHR